MVISQKFRTEKIAYVVNDTPKKSQVFALSLETGAVRANLSFKVPIPHPFGRTGLGDWEAMAIGTCRGRNDGSTCVFVADSGQNCARIPRNCKHLRSSPPALIQFQEPDELRHLPSDTPVKAERIEFVFPKEEKFDAEALMFNGDDLFIFTKEGSGNERGRTRLFRFPPVSTPINALHKLTLQADISLNDGERVTGAAECDKGFVMRTYSNLRWFRWSDIYSPCILPFVNEPQGETIALDGSDLYTLSEGTHQPINKMTCALPDKSKHKQ